MKSKSYPYNPSDKKDSEPDQSRRQSSRRRQREIDEASEKKNERERQRKKSVSQHTHGSGLIETHVYIYSYTWEKERSAPRDLETHKDEDDEIYRELNVETTRGLYTITCEGSFSGARGYWLLKVRLYTSMPRDFLSLTLVDPVFARCQFFSFIGHRERRIFLKLIYAEKKTLRDIDRSESFFFFF